MNKRSNILFFFGFCFLHLLFVKKKGTNINFSTIIKPEYVVEHEKACFRCRDQVKHLQVVPKLRKRKLLRAIHRYIGKECMQYYLAKPESVFFSLQLETATNEYQNTTCNRGRLSIDGANHMVAMFKW